MLTLATRIGSSANFLTTMLTGNGVPNDVISNFNSLSIILLGPCLNVSLPQSTLSKLVPNRCIHSTDCIRHFAVLASIMDLLLVSPRAFSSALWPASVIRYFATKHTNPTPVVGTEVPTLFALTMAWSRLSRSGGQPFRTR